MSEHSERLARIETKLDDLINLRREDRIVAEKKCTAHTEWTEAIHKRTLVLESDKNKVIGAGKLLAYLGGGGTLVGFVLKLLHHRGG